MAGHVRLAALAAVVGGLLWVVKGGVILLGGRQPPLAFELAQFLFAVSLVGLHTRLQGRGGRLAAVGVVLAYLAGASWVVNLLVGSLAPSLVPDEGSLTMLTPTYVVGGLGPFLGLVLLGSAALRGCARALPGRWRALPLALGLLAPPAIATGPWIHIEVPIVVIGLAWMMLGYALWLSGSAHVEAVPAPSDRTRRE